MLIFITIVFLLVAFLTLWPVKKAVRIEDLQDSYYHIVAPTAVTGYNWRLAGSHEGMISENERSLCVVIWWKDPNTILSKTLRMDSPNLYVIYGDSSKCTNEYGEEFLLLCSRDFDIVAPIERGNSLRFFPKNYLVPLDYLCFNR